MNTSSINLIAGPRSHGPMKCCIAELFHYNLKHLAFVKVYSNSLKAGRVKECQKAQVQTDEIKRDQGSPETYRQGSPRSWAVGAVVVTAYYALFFQEGL